MIRLLGRVRTLLLPAAFLAGAALFVLAVHEHYPIGDWLFWHYAKAWAWCALFAVACLSSGNLALEVLVRRTLPLREHAVFALALGVLTFFYAMFLGGLLGLYGQLFSVLMPCALFASGAPRLVRRGRRAWRHLGQIRVRARRPWWFYPVLLFGLYAVGLVYFAILSPANVAFDSRFYHLAVAQQYATEGGIQASPIAWAPMTIPHLASVLYTWSFTLPHAADGSEMFARMICAAHLEFVIFLFTLGSLPVMVRWLVPGARVGASWVALFLFPGILLYDASLSVAADHIAAFWAIPAYLALRRAYRNLDPRYCGLLAAMLGAALLTKYQAMYLMAVPIVALIGRALLLIVRKRLRSTAAERKSGATAAMLRPLGGLAIALIAGLVVTSPHWLKNWAWYGDPLFPYLAGIFPPNDWAPDLPYFFNEYHGKVAQKWSPQGTLSQRFIESCKATVMFSFEPHDWPRYHGKVPVFGSLFTLSLLVLPFLKRTKRTWGVVIATHVGIFIWFWTMHQDRYLQILVPWMAVVVAAMIALAWRENVVTRVATCVLVLTQVVWGGDVYFIPTHAMTKQSPAVTTAELLGQGYRKKYDQRYVIKGMPYKVQQSGLLPDDAGVLLHEYNLSLGLWRPVLSDAAGLQWGLRYELFESPAALHQRLTELGMTHILTRTKSARTDSLGSDLRFFDYLSEAQSLESFGDFRLYALPTQAPSAARNDMVAYLGCGKIYARGLHPLKNLWVRERRLLEKQPKRLPASKPGPKRPSDLGKWLEQADYVVTEAGCKSKPTPKQLAPFKKIVSWKKQHLWARK